MMLYRYKNIDKNIISYLQTYKLFFSSSLDFNDPYDCDMECILTPDKETAKRLYDEYLERLKQLLDSVKSKVIQYNAMQTDFDDPPSKRNWAPDYYEMIHKQHVVYYEIYSALRDKNQDEINFRLHDWWMEIKNIVMQRYGILCFSASNKNMLLWSHYANGHRGLCLMFDTNERPVRGWKHFTYYPVHYSNDRIIDITNIGFDMAFEKLLTTKSLDWSYESEYRLISMGGKGLQQGRMPALKGIIFGSKISENNRDIKLEFYEALRKYSIQRRPIRALELFYAEKIQARYELKLHRIKSLEEARRIIDA